MSEDKKARSIFTFQGKQIVYHCNTCEDYKGREEVAFKLIEDNPMELILRPHCDKCGIPVDVREILTFDEEASLLLLEAKTSP